VWQFFIVFPTPRFDLFPGILKTQKPVLVQTLLPEPTVERLDISVIRRLPGAAEVELHVIPVSPQIYVLRDELWAVSVLIRKIGAIIASLNKPPWIEKKSLRLPIY
jgi:hypothetical protein